MPKNENNALQGYLQAIAHFPLLTKEQEIELGTKKAKGDKESRQSLINSNLRLVVSCAKNKYDQFKDVLTIELDDLIQDGTLGLITAVDRYDAAKGCRFSTGALYWINQAIYNGIEKNRAIKLPDNQIDAISFVSKAKKAIEAAIDREPEKAELSAFLSFKWSVDDLEKLEILSEDAMPISLNSPSGDEESSEFGDLIADTSKTPEELAIQNHIKDSMYAIISTLPKRDQIILAKAFGLFGNEKKTLEEISIDLFDLGYANPDGKRISKERIRQLRDSALNTIKPKLKTLM